MSTLKSKDEVPTFTPSDYVKFFGAGALAATLTHGVMDLPIPCQSGIKNITNQLTGRHAH